ncbi:GNAT family N-acetyltransferase [Parabacteroides sp.]|uniref:GNAT family N-acetyltransferase n=1 Tax=Parabacteroides sp. TaxID=1869337 RepID=UPI00257EE67D|nr:GNAT family N-acetyltransferase [Parabacteroides sp.]
MYDDCITHSLSTPNPLPQWCFLMNEDEIIGRTELIMNDFISRMYLYPWVCGLYIEEKYRGNAYGFLLLAKAKEDSRKVGFSNL